MGANCLACCLGTSRRLVSCGRYPQGGVAMSELTVTIAPAPSVSVPTGLPISFVDVAYTRKITGNPGDNLSDLPSEVSDTVRVALDSKLTAAFTLADVKPGSLLELRFLAGNGSAALSKALKTGEQPPVPPALPSAHGGSQRLLRARR